MTNQTTKATTRPIEEILKSIHSFKDFERVATEPQRIDFYTERNNAIDTDRKAQADIDLLVNVAVRATWSTLNFLVSSGAGTTETAQSIDAPKEEKPVFGYNMALKLIKDLPHDITAFKSNSATENYLDSIDLLQEVFCSLSPFVCSDILINDDTIIYTKQLKNGGVKDYTLYKFACNTIRKYIQSKAQKEYKKQAYIIGYKDNGEPVYTTKRPKDNLTDINENTRKAFINQYGLTAKEQEIIAHYINGLKVADIAPLVNMTFEATKKALYRAKQTIKAKAQQSKMIKE